MRVLVVFCFGLIFLMAPNWNKNTLITQAAVPGLPALITYGFPVFLVILAFMVLDKFNIIGPKLADCGEPPSIPYTINNQLIYASPGKTIAGSDRIYDCPDSIDFVTVCTNAGTWKPDPANFECGCCLK